VRSFGLLLVVAGVLALPGSAGGASYTWQGYVGPGQGNSQCAWYVSQSSCPGWNYWHQHNAANNGGGIVLAGFENANTIRGTYLSSFQSVITYPSDYGMCCYLKSHVTWCNWLFECSTQPAAHIWFKTWT
jgi:hypothetical protein